MTEEGKKEDEHHKEDIKTTRKRIQVDTRKIDENTSSAMWTHQPRTKKKFSTRIDVQLIPCDDEGDDIDFNSPELGKLCEKFLKL